MHNQKILFPVPIPRKEVFTFFLLSYNIQVINMLIIVFFLQISDLLHSHQKFSIDTKHAIGFDE